MQRLLTACLGIVLAGFAAAAHAETILIEAESFAGRGGWLVDQQSIDSIGSAYLLAHGLGEPVADATTAVHLPKAGSWRVFVRTKDWVARWNAPGAPGKFQLLVNGEPLATTFGVKGRDWSWHYGGAVTLPAGKATLALHDLTGFDGRCDAVLLTDDATLTPPDDARSLASLRRRLLGLPERPADGGSYDIVVVGGGVAGCCSAVSAARLGLSVALVQDRSVLGGNSSSEVRVWIKGQVCQSPHPVIGEIVEEMDTRPSLSPGPAEMYGDDVKLRVVQAEKNLRLLLGQHVSRVELSDRRIAAVVAQDVLTHQETRLAGRWFVDATGDATVGVLAGADYDVTRRAHLGSSNMWYTIATHGPAPFPRCPWALDLTNKPIPTELNKLGPWFWESGFDLDSVADAEAIRDHNLRAIYGTWDCLKNSKRLYSNRRLKWAAYISGKRESRRLLGDVILARDDVLGARPFADACFPCMWTIDLHYPDPQYAAAAPGNAFLSVAEFTRFKTPYWAPYRCLYSRNVPNLFMAGRDVSVTHEALGTVRVQGTGGAMGEVVGRSAALCKRHDCDPRVIYAQHLDELTALLDRSTKAAAQ